jgi:hypothetical protein
MTWRAQQAPIRRLGFFDNIKKSVQETIDSDPELKKNIDELSKNEYMKKMGGTAEDAKKKMEDIDVERLKKTAEEYQKSASDSFSAFSENMAPTEESKKEAGDAAERLKKDAANAADRASKAAGDAYTKVTDAASEEAEKFAKEFESIRAAKEKVEEASRKAASLKKSYLGENFFGNFKDSVSEAAKDLFGTNAEEKTINKPIYAPEDSFSQTKGKKEKKKREWGEKAEEEEEPEKAESPEETVGGGAVMVVEQQKGTWEKITARLRETPLMQELFKAQKVLADTEAGQAAGESAKAARDRISDKVEDATEFWETSQNPWVYRASVSEYTHWN